MRLAEDAALDVGCLVVLQVGKVARGEFEAVKLAGGEGGYITVGCC